MDIREIDLNVEGLKTKLSELGLPTGGRKDELGNISVLMLVIQVRNMTM